MKSILSIYPLLAFACIVNGQPVVRLPAFSDGYLDISAKEHFCAFFDDKGTFALKDAQSASFISLDSFQYPQGLLRDNHCRIWLRCSTDSLSRPNLDTCSLFWHFNLRQTKVEGFRVDQKGQVQYYEWGKSTDGQDLATLFLLPFETDNGVPYTWYFRIQPFPFSINDFSPRIMSMKGWRDRSAVRYYEMRMAHNITVCLTGISLFISLFTFIQWALYKRPIYFYYSCFLLACIANLYRYEMEFALPVSGLTAFLTTHGNYITTYLGHAFYFLFINKFLSLKWQMPGLYRITRWTTYFSFALLLLHFVLFYLFDRHDWAHEVYLFRGALLSIGFYSLLAIIYKRPPFYIFIFCGGISMALGALIWIISGYRIEQGHPAIPYATVIFYFGLMLETLFFLSGLGYQFKISEESKRKAQQKLLDERERITRDLHDDVGSTLNSMALMSEQAIKQLETRPKEADKTLQIIKTNARETLQRISDIVWSVNPNIETLGDLVSRMRNFTFSLFSGTQTRVRFIVPSGMDALQITAEERWQLYLIFKEAVNNARKYAMASQLDIGFIAEEASIRLSIQDNGLGFEKDKEPLGNGLRTMQERARLIAGTLSFRSEKGQGTTITVDWIKNYPKM